MSRRLLCTYSGRCTTSTEFHIQIPTNKKDFHSLLCQPQRRHLGTDLRRQRQKIQGQSANRVEAIQQTIQQTIGRLFSGLFSRLLSRLFTRLLSRLSMMHHSRLCYGHVQRQFARQPHGRLCGRLTRYLLKRFRGRLVQVSGGHLRRHS